MILTFHLRPLARRQGLCHIVCVISIVYSPEKSEKYQYISHLSSPIWQTIGLTPPCQDFLIFLWIFLDHKLSLSGLKWLRVQIVPSDHDWAFVDLTVWQKQFGEKLQHEFFICTINELFLWFLEMLRSGWCFCSVFVSFAFHLFHFCWFRKFELLFLSESHQIEKIPIEIATIWIPGLKNDSLKIC